MVYWAYSYGRPTTWVGRARSKATAPELRRLLTVVADMASVPDHCVPEGGRHACLDLHVINKRVCKKPQMAWTPCGAHLLLQIRTRVLNGDWEATFREWYLGFYASPQQVAA
jgi:hypothetical protein